MGDSVRVEKLLHRMSVLSVAVNKRRWRRRGRRRGRKRGKKYFDDDDDDDVTLCQRRLLFRLLLLYNRLSTAHT